MQVTRVLETCLYVEDLDKAEDFYTQVLGLDCIAKVEGRHVFFRFGPGVLLLFNPEATAIDNGEGIHSQSAVGAGHVAFHMRDDEIDAWRSHLQGRGVAIELEYTWPNGGYSIYFRDPHGNSLELVTPKTWGISD